jgi:hypothetical protein
LSPARLSTTRTFASAGLPPRRIAQIATAHDVDSPDHSARLAARELHGYALNV